MWERRSYPLAPLNNITYIKVKFKWTKIEHNVFNKINQIVASAALFTYQYLMNNLILVPMLDIFN